MKELNMNNTTDVAGGLVPPTITLLTDARIAVTTIPGAGAVVSAAAAGWEIGNWLNEKTPIQTWISDTIGS